jgi:hypothetical protein
MNSFWGVREHATLLPGDLELVLAIIDTAKSENFS